jgi:hypothetical protein
MPSHEVESDPRAAIDHAWYGWSAHRNVTDYSQREVFAEAFRRGAQWSARLSGQLSPHIAHLSDFLIWLMEDREGQADWDAFVQPPDVEPVLTSNGAGTPDDPW